MGKDAHRFFSRGRRLNSGAWPIGFYAMEGRGTLRWIFATVWGRSFHTLCIYRKRAPETSRGNISLPPPRHTCLLLNMWVGKILPREPIIQYLFLIPVPCRWYSFLISWGPLYLDVICVCAHQYILILSFKISVFYVIDFLGIKLAVPLVFFFLCIFTY